MISWKRINALLQQEWHLSKRSLEIVVDTVFFAVIDLLVFGYLSLYLLGNSSGLAAQYLIFGALWWEVIRISQYSMTMNSLWNVWSRNLSNMFIAPISISEYLIAQFLSATLKSGVIVFCVLVPLAASIFHFQFWKIGAFALFATFANLLLFSCSVGLLLLGLIFRYGTRVQALAWACIFIFQPLTAVFYPVSILPEGLQMIAWAIPLTHVFEAGRYTLQFGYPDVYSYGVAFLMNIILFVASLILFKHLLHRAQDSGQFVRNEG